MSDYEVIKEQGDYRVILRADAIMDEPYSDGASPLLRMDLCYPYRAEHVANAGREYPSGPRIAEAATLWGPPNRPEWDLFVKYLRAYHGVTQVETYNSGSYWYVTYDSQEWRDYTGCEPGHADMDEYKAWINGEVYIVEVQKRVTWRAVSEDATGVPEFSDRVTWEPAGDEWPVGGYYGSYYAEDEAKHQFEDFLSSLESEPSIG